MKWPITNVNLIEMKAKNIFENQTFILCSFETLLWAFHVQSILYFVNILLILGFSNTVRETNLVNIPCNWNPKNQIKFRKFKIMCIYNSNVYRNGLSEVERIWWFYLIKWWCLNSRKKTVGKHITEINYWKMLRKKKVEDDRGKSARVLLSNRSNCRNRVTCHQRPRVSHLHN